MLPSLRLIVAGFLCGFVAVYAGLRLATSLNAIHQAFPITVAQAASAPSVGMGATRAPAPLLYDMRFVTSAAASAPLFASVTLEMPERVMPPQLPAEDVRKDEDAVSEPHAALAAIDPAPAPAVEVAPVDPEPEPPVATAAIDPTATAVAEPPAPAVATIEPDPSPLPEPAVSEPEPTPLAAPAAQELPKTATIAPLTAAPDDASAEAIAPALPATATTASIPDEAAPAAAVAAKPPKAATAKPRAAAKLIRKRHRVVRRTAGNGFANPSGNSTYNWK